MAKPSAAARDFLLLYVNGVRHELRGEQVFQSLSDLLRRQLGQTGTKIVCAEGDCGACAVLIGRAAADGSRLDYAAADSCILFLWQLDCRHIVTVEGLSCEGKLHPVQQALVDCHGSQCGFCTPGFAIQLAELTSGRAESPTCEAVRLALSGSLCRCTGYEPIVKAACSLAEVPDLNTHYPPQGMLDDFAKHAGQSLQIDAPDTISILGGSTGKRKFFAPSSLPEALKLKAAHPQAMVISGGTELGVRINKHQVDPAEVISLNNLPAELEAVRVERRVMQIGGRASWSAVERACDEHLPEFAEIVRRFGGPAIRNVATMAGNLANGSPIADGIPVILVMEGSLELTSPRGVRRVPINQFYLGYKKMDSSPDELITRIDLPLPEDGETLKLYKVSKRRDLDISTFTAAVWLRLEQDRIAACRIAYGGVAPTVVRLSATEAFLVDQEFSEATFRKAGKLARGEVTPISDVRSGRDYRWQLCENILLRFFHEVSPASAAIG